MNVAKQRETALEALAQAPLDVLIIGGGIVGSGVARDAAMRVHLDDVMVRRTSWHYYHRDAGQKSERVADWMGEILGWTDEEREAEVQRYRPALDRASERTVHSTV